MPAAPRIRLYPSTPWGLGVFDRVPLPAFWVGVGIGLDIKKLTLPVVADINHNRASSLTPAIPDQRADCGPGSQLFEFRFE